jgi:hypothetical protein
MRYFLVEIAIHEIDRIELERVTRTLRSAQSRARNSASGVRALIAGVSRDDGRFVCLMEASSAQVVRGVVALAFLPAGRIREITHLEPVQPQ